MLVALDFHLNCLVLNENLWMRTLVFIGNFSCGFGLKNKAFFSQTYREKQVKGAFSRNRTCHTSMWKTMFSTLLRTPGACGSTPRAHDSIPRAHGFSFQCIFSFFFIFFSVFLLQTCLGTKFPQLVMSSETSWIFIPCLPNSSWCILFLPNYMLFQWNTSKTTKNWLVYGRTIITWLDMKTLQNVS